MLTISDKSSKQGRREQIAKVVRPEQAGTAEGGLVCAVGAGKTASMRRRRRCGRGNCRNEVDDEDGCLC